MSAVADPEDLAFVAAAARAYGRDPVLAVEMKVWRARDGSGAAAFAPDGPHQQHRPMPLDAAQRLIEAGIFEAEPIPKIQAPRKSSWNMETYDWHRLTDLGRAALAVTVATELAETEEDAA